MSYASAIDQIKGLLSADPISAKYPSVKLVFAPDPRLETLADMDGRVDSAFLLVNESAGNPYPYVQSNSPSEFFARLKLQVCTLLHTSILEEDKTCTLRAQAVQEVLFFRPPVDFACFDVSAPTRIRAGEDRRILWEVRFSLRYSA